MPNNKPITRKDTRLLNQALQVDSTITDSDLKELINLGCTYDEMRDFLPIGHNQRQIKFLILDKLGVIRTDMRKILFDD